MDTKSDMLKKKSMTKKQYKKDQKNHRVHIPWNTGSRPHKDKRKIKEEGYE
jgi:hypothetical protein